MAGKAIAINYTQFGRRYTNRLNIRFADAEKFFRSHSFRLTKSGEDNLTVYYDIYKPRRKR